MRAHVTQSSQVWARSDTSTWEGQAGSVEQVEQEPNSEDGDGLASVSARKAAHMLLVDRICLLQTFNKRHHAANPLTSTTFSSCARAAASAACLQAATNLQGHSTAEGVLARGAPQMALLGCLKAAD